MPNQTQCQPSQNEPSLLRAGAHYDYELSAGRNAHSDYLETQISSRQVSGAVITTSSEEPQVEKNNIFIFMQPTLCVCTFDYAL